MIKNQLFPDFGVLSENFAATFQENYSSFVNEIIQNQAEFLSANYKSEADEFCKKEIREQFSRSAL